MVTDDAMLATVAAIYDAGLDPALWPDAMEHMAEMLRATAGAIGFVDTSSRVTFRSHVRADAQVIAEYLDYYRTLDPLLSKLWVRPPREAFCDEMMQPKRELWKSRLYNEWIKPNGMEHAIQGFAFRDDERNGFLALARAPSLESYSRAEVDVVTALLPHIARALNVQVRLQAAQITRDSTVEALERLAQAVFLVDARAVVRHANKAAEDLLKRVRHLDGGSTGFTLGQPNQSRVLRTLVARASDTGPGRAGGAVLLDHPGGLDPLVAHVVPCRPGSDLAWAGAVRPTAIVIVAGPRRKDTAEAERTLHALFGLTAAEAKAACLVAAGTGVRAAAAALGVEPSTVRTHLVRAYAKTGTPRQAKLSALLDQVTTLTS